MNEPELESFEQELRRLKPARPPGDLMARLAVADQAQEIPESRSQAEDSIPWAGILIRWFAPASAVAVIIGMVVIGIRFAPRTIPRTPHLAAPLAPAAAAADALEFDRQLIASFDAVAELPTGEPVRFNCRKWQDRVIFRDPVHDLVIERTVPRLEVIPVRMETY